MGKTAQAPSLDTQLFHDAFNASPMGIAVETLEGQLLFVNPAFCSFLGFSEEELRSKHCVDFSPPEDAQKDWSLFQQLRAGSIDHYQLEKRYFRRDGSLVWGHLSISLLKGRPSPLVVGMVQDISAKKEAEEALHESEERLRLAVQAGKMFAYSWDAATDVIERSGESAEILGVKNDDAATGTAISAMVHPDDRQKLETALTKLSIDKPTLQITYRIIRTDGGIAWLERNSRAYFDEDGKIKRIVGMIVDVTERQHAAEALRESETRFRLVTDTAPVMVWMSGVDKLCTYFNKPWLDFTGRSIEQELGNGWAEGVHKDDFQRCLETYIQSFDSRKKFQMEYRLRRHDGEYRWIFDIGVPRYGVDGSFAGYIGSCIDVTERRRAEDALHELNRSLQEQSALLRSREELLEIFVKNVSAPVAMLDREMRYVQVSERWCTDYLQGRAQVIGRSHYEVFPDMPERWKEAHRRALEGETLRAEEDRWDGKDGPHWARWEVRPWKTPEGLVGGILIFAEDVTRRKQAEEALSQVSRKLIESQEQDRARIGRDLHDDINQRLALLAIDIERLRQHPADSAAEVSSGLTGIKDRINEIAADVQTISHQLHSPQLEILGIVGAMRGFCREFATRQSAIVDFTHDNVPKGVSHEVSLCLFRVLQEALHNAVKHSNARHYRVKLGCSANTLHLTVSDRGTGFNTEVAMSSGGLGLVSMHERVRLANGTIVIKSTPMGGTIVDVRVPLILERQPQQSAV